VARILWITDEPPDRGLSGGSIRQAHQLVALAARHRVTVVAAGCVPAPEVADAVEEVVVVSGSEGASQIRRRTNRFLAQFTPAGPTDVVAAAARRAAAQRILPRLVAEADVVVPQHHSMGPGAPGAGSRPKRRCTHRRQ
jgi:hypothetical protein